MGRLLSSLFFVLLTTSTALAQLREPTPERASVLPTAPVVTRFPNGLTLVVVPWESPGIVAYYTLVRVGARDEVERGHSGFAHLFEHMMFRGTESVPKEEYERRIQSFGADNNAYTTQDFTLYTITAPSQSLDAIAALEADRFQHLSYSEPAFRTETGAVLGEYNKSASDPYTKMFEALSEVAFTRHTYGHTTLGYLADIQAMPTRYQYSLNFFRRFYTPDDCTVIVAGDVEPDHVRELISGQYGRWRGRRARTRITAEPEQTAARDRHIEWEGSTPPRMLIGYRRPAFVGADRARTLRDTAALEIVHSLGFSPSSPLYQRLVVDQQKLLELESWTNDFSVDPQLFVVSAVLADSATFDDTRDAIDRELARIGAEATEAQVNEAKAHLRYSLLMSLETASDAAQAIGRFMAFGGEVDTLDQYVAALASVTMEDVRRVASTYLVPAHRTTITLSNGGAQ